MIRWIDGKSERRKKGHTKDDEKKDIGLPKQVCPYKGYSA